jgi:hypothetical protein
MSRFAVTSIKLTFLASTFSAKAKSHSLTCPHFEIASFQTLFSAITTVNTTHNKRSCMWHTSTVRHPSKIYSYLISVSFCIPTSVSFCTPRILIIIFAALSLLSGYIFSSESLLVQGNPEFPKV